MKLLMQLVLLFSKYTKSPHVFSALAENAKSIIITNVANNMLTFFKDYISYNGNIEVISSEFISYFICVSILLIIVISIVIYSLMGHKKKPRLLYVILIIVSIISCVLFKYLYNSIRGLETTIQSARTIRLYRDISRFNFCILFLICIKIC